MDNQHFIESVLGELNITFKKDEPILMSADAGGFKPLTKLCNQLNWYEEKRGSLQTIFENGELKNEVSLSQIRTQLNNQY